MMSTMPRGGRNYKCPIGILNFPGTWIPNPNSDNVSVAIPGRWNPVRPENWTLATLRVKLKELGVNVPDTLPKKTLLQLYVLNSDARPSPTTQQSIRRQPSATITRSEFDQLQHENIPTLQVPDQSAPYTISPDIVRSSEETDSLPPVNRQSSQPSQSSTLTMDAIVKEMRDLRRMVQ